MLDIGTGVPGTICAAALAVPAHVVAFLAVSLAGGLAVSVPSLLEARRLRRRHDGRRLEELASLLDGLDLDAGETLVASRIVDAAGEPLEKCLGSIEVFDRGVERFLARASRLPSLQRVDLLRSIRSLRNKLGFDTTRPFQTLQSTRAIPRGQVVSLAPAGSDLEGRAGDEEREACEATVIEVDDEGLTVRLDPVRSSPAARSRLLGAAPPPLLTVRLFRSDDSAYIFRSALLGVCDGEAGILRLAHPRKILRQQRRRFLRVDTNDVLHFRWFPASTSRRLGAGREEVERLTETHTGVVTNLSGGGIQLRASGAGIALDDWIELHFPFLPPPLDREFCLARVVRVYEEPPDGLFGLSFERPSARLQSAIMREVERRHREARARRAGRSPAKRQP